MGDYACMTPLMTPAASLKPRTPPAEKGRSRASRLEDPVTAAHSSRRRSGQKPKKPYPGFPLFPHSTGRWAKKIRGKLFYFGKWDHPEEALERFNREWPYLSQGRTPPPADEADGLTVRELCNRFLTSKSHLVQAGELSPHTFRDYHRICKRVIDAFGQDRMVLGLAPDDFERHRSTMAETLRMESHLASLHRRFSLIRWWATFAEKRPAINTRYAEQNP